MKLIQILLILIILSASVSAIGQTFYLESPSNSPHQAIKIGLDDRIEFEMLNGKHTIILDQIKEKTGFVELDVFPYINKDPEDRQVYYVNIDQTHFATLDLNRDYINDVEVRLITLDGITGASFRIDLINKSIFPDNIKPKDFGPEPKKEKDIITPIATTIIVFVIMFAIYFLAFKKKN